MLLMDSISTAIPENINASVQHSFFEGLNQQFSVSQRERCSPIDSETFITPRKQYGPDKILCHIINLFLYSLADL